LFRLRNSANLRSLDLTERLSEVFFVTRGKWTMNLTSQSQLVQVIAT
jgi:mannose-6-phosphate isomerase-like protein (cupin superfamily)